MIGYISKIYVLHVTEGYEDREKSIKEQFEKLKLNFEFVLEYDIPQLREEQLSKYFSPKHTLRMSELSCSMKHIEALKKIEKAQGDIFLVLEDDVIFSQDSLIMFSNIEKELKDIDRKSVV